MARRAETAQHRALVEGIKKIFPNATGHGGQPLEQMSVRELNAQLENWQKNLNPDLFGEYHGPIKTKPAAPQSEWLLVPEVAAQFKVTDRVIYNWLAEGKLKGYRLGTRAVRIRRSDLDALLTPYTAEVG